MDRHLRAFAKGELPPADAPRDKVLLPLAVLAEVQKEKAEKKQALARAKREHQVAEAAVTQHPRTCRRCDASGAPYPFAQCSASRSRLPGALRMSAVRTICVFIASPGDLAVGRAAFQQVLEELNAGFGDALDIKFEPLGWEDTLASTGRRSQECRLSLRERTFFRGAKDDNRSNGSYSDRCDVFILAMHRRRGQAAPDAHPYSSYTEEEFHRAFARWQKKRRGKPQAPEIFVFFKHIDSASMADAGPQLQKVLDFRKSLEESRQVLYAQLRE